MRATSCPASPPDQLQGRRQSSRPPGGSWPPSMERPTPGVLMAASPARGHPSTPQRLSSIGSQRACAAIVMCDAASASGLRDCGVAVDLAFRGGPVRHDARNPPCTRASCTGPSERHIDKSFHRWGRRGTAGGAGRRTDVPVSSRE